MTIADVPLPHSRPPHTSNSRVTSLKHDKLLSVCCYCCCCCVQHRTSFPALRSDLAWAFSADDTLDDVEITEAVLGRRKGCASSGSCRIPPAFTVSQASPEPSPTSLTRLPVAVAGHRPGLFGYVCSLNYAYSVVSGHIDGERPAQHQQPGRRRVQFHQTFGIYRYERTGGTT